MAAKIIGRLQEKQILTDCYRSNKAEFVAVYGRRRIGKTFLIKNFFADKIDFYLTGIYEGTKSEQLTFFNKQLCMYAGFSYPKVDNWFDAFDQLKHYISTLKKKQVVVFIDELPWLDTPRSRFIKALELFWNSWGADCNRLKLIVCGSATTWMISQLLGNKGGLHNRVTRRIKLQPFNLSETAAFLKSEGIVWNRHQVAEAYMIMGGTPYYLQLLRKEYSLPQNIDRLFFARNAELKNEYEFLFRSLFSDTSLYRLVVEALSRKSKGLTRTELISILKIRGGGQLTSVLENLCNCDFIRRYSSFGKKERDVMYQLTDLFVLFYLKFVKNHNDKDEHLWSNTIDSPQRRSWSGYAFEQLCLHHIPQIKSSLSIGGIQSDVCAWSARSSEEHSGGQIDFIIDRRDQIINLCEMKYSLSKFEITKSYNAELQDRKELFRQLTKTRKALHLTIISTYGIKKNSYSGMIQSEITLSDLFNAKNE